MRFNVTIGQSADPITHRTLEVTAASRDAAEAAALKDAEEEELADFHIISVDKA